MGRTKRMEQATGKNDERERVERGGAGREGRMTEEGNERDRSVGMGPCRFSRRAYERRTDAEPRLDRTRRRSTGCT